MRVEAADRFCHKTCLKVYRFWKFGELLNAWFLIDLGWSWSSGGLLELIGSSEMIGRGGGDGITGELVGMGSFRGYFELLEEVVKWLEANGF
jgi:hypothetical protein